MSLTVRQKRFRVDADRAGKLLRRVRDSNAPWVVELFVLYSLLLVLAFVLPGPNELTAINPHPFWIPVLLLSVQYGPLGGFAAALVVAAFRTDNTQSHCLHAAGVADCQGVGKQAAHRFAQQCADMGKIRFHGGKMLVDCQAHRSFPLLLLVVAIHYAFLCSSGRLHGRILTVAPDLIGS